MTDNTLFAAWEYGLTGHSLPPCKMNLRLSFAIAAMLAPASVHAQDFELSSGEVRLQLNRNPADRGYSLSFRHASRSVGTYSAGKPLSMKLNGERLDGSYSDVLLEDRILVCQGIIASENGTRFVFTDRFSADQPGSFEMSRDVEVRSASAKDVSFNTLFGLQVSPASTIDDFEFFVPGIWYRTNFKTKMAGELAVNPSDQYFLFREDRLPLPIVTARETSSGRTVSLIHSEADPTTFADEGKLQLAVDERMQFGSIGVRQLQGTSVTFMFPGSEGERNHVMRRSRNSWAHRSHPVKHGIRHRYKLLIGFSITPSYPNAVETSWKQAFDAYHPSVRPVNVGRAFEGLIETLDHYWVGTSPPGNYDAPGFPFSVYLPEGNVRLYNYQMGFIGRQLSNAYFLIHQGLASGSRSLREKGEQVIDFWAANSLTASGLPRTWYDAAREGAIGSWRSSDNPRGGTAIRVATTGMEGMLSAWELMNRKGVDKPAWLSACRRFGDWLVANQNDDGSYFIAYDHRSDGSRNAPTSTSRFGTINPIRFLVMLHQATGDRRYKTAAIRAGEFCRNTIHEDYSYVGSVIDNPNVIDRETGQEATSAFLAMYDLTGEKEWLDAAVQAARYTETWMYAYDVPPEIGRDDCDFPADRSIVGQTVIATGHSAADLGLAFSSFDYFRLYLFTGDDHFLEIARLLVHNTKQSLNWDGSLYPGKPKGLQLEAFTVTVPRRKGVMQCLSWNYAAHLDPLIRFQDSFGSMDIEAIEQLPLERRLEMNRQVGKRR
jgi:hypothetical protein